MSIPFENNDIPVPDKFKGWYCQQASGISTISAGALYPFDDIQLNYEGIVTFQSGYTQVTIPETGVWFIGYSVSNLGPGPCVPIMQRVRKTVQSDLAQGYGNNSGLQVYVDGRNEGYFSLEKGDILYVRNSVAAGVQYLGSLTKSNFWEGHLVATNPP